MSLGLIFSAFGVFGINLFYHQAQSVNAQSHTLELVILAVIIMGIIFPIAFLMLVPNTYFRNKLVRFYSRLVGLLGVLAGIFLSIIYFPFFIMSFFSEPEYMQFTALIMILCVLLFITAPILFRRARSADQVSNTD
ncbi:hypothetical protein DD509_00750 [Dehalogenimonas alkenigignens]|nr:hypothetical protein DD509_00750 [Dehalogenimonas alkenigignens]